MTLSPFRRPYIIVLMAIFMMADIGGIAHAFRLHGRRDGIIALVLPPYGLYRAVESLRHPRQLDTATMVQTSQGRRELSQGLRIKPDVWTVLLNLITIQSDHSLRTTMDEGGAIYDITVTVPPAGLMTLTIQPKNDKNLTISMTDENRDQTPEMLKIVKTVNGKPEIHDTPIEKFSAEDSSQFLLAWALAWGTIAEERQAAAHPELSVQAHGVPMTQ